MTKYFLSLFLLLAFDANTQTSGLERMSSVQGFDEIHSDFANYAFDNIGPTVFSGRVCDVAVDPDDPAHFYVAYASGGLWETKNNGTTFDPIFDSEVVMTIGAIAVNWSTNEIWVGTGEVNSSRSSYAGLGIYKSSDNGDSWQYAGLEESHHIGRIVLHPSDPNTAWVAVLGHLYTDNVERGVYKTTDGGESWNHVLAINDKTGVVDLAINPTNQQELYAAAWQRDRKAWNFVESGEGSGIYKSIDGGESWNRMNIDGSGFPMGEGVGRIGLSIVSDSAGETHIYALLDNYDRRPPEEDEDDEGELTKEEFKTMSKEALLALDKEDLETFLKDNRFPEKYDVDAVITMVQDDKVQPEDLALYLENANALLFDTPVIGAELYKSTDNGQSWTKTHDGYFDGLYYSYGYYFGVVKANPKNADQVYVAGVPILRSDDGGKTFSNVNGQNVHVDHHSIWINPEQTSHVINGNDGGINISYDSGENWYKCNSPSVGQFYYINVDNAKPYNVYGGTQDNGVWAGSHRYREGVRWHGSGKYPYQSILGGDGMQVQIDPRDNNTVYTGFQFGNYFRINKKSGQRKYITPRHELGERPYRWNWQTPIHLSVHNPDILYMGGERLFRSMNQGDEFTPISEDLTQGGIKGDVPYGTLSTVHESPLQFGLLYCGSDDGYIHVSRDGGHIWGRISDDLPQNLWVSRLQASAHTESVVYASLNGYRNDDFNSYVYRSDDYGQTWQRIGLELPLEPVNVIKEDPNHSDILYVGTDRGVYVSLDEGLSFARFAPGLPNVPVHDLVIQQRDKDLLIGTHGRSIFKSDLESLYQMNQSNELFVSGPEKFRFNESLGNRNNIYSDYTTNEQEFVIVSNQKAKTKIRITSDDQDLEVHVMEEDLVKGINYVSYDLAINPDQVKNYKKKFEGAEKMKESMNGKYYLLPGKYSITVIQGKEEASANFIIEEK